MASRVDKIYGDAYISVKTDEDDLLEALEEAKAVKEILDSNTDFVNFLNHPQITKEEKMEAAKNVFDGRVSDDMTGFLMIIIKKGRFKEFDGIFTYIISNIKRQLGIGALHVTSAMPLSQEQKDKILKKVGEEATEIVWMIGLWIIPFVQSLIRWADICHKYNYRTGGR